MTNNKLSFTIRTELLKYKRVLFDNVTGLPTLPLLMDKLKQMLGELHIIGVIYVDVASFTRLEIVYGWQIYDLLLKEVTIALHKATADVFANQGLLSINSIRGDEFFMFLCTTGKQNPITSYYLESACERVEEIIEEHLSNTNQPEEFRNFKMSTGYAIISYTPLVRLERTIYRALEEARQMANYQEKRENLKRKEQLKQIIANENIYSVFQPIVYLKDKKLLGYEALAVGPEQSYFESTESIFAFAYEIDMNLELDRLCRHKTLVGAQSLSKPYYLFINTAPAAILDPQLKKLPNLVKKYGLDLNRLVLEITERSAIGNFDVFMKNLDYFKELGIKFAIDDAGAGYASLNSIAQLKPDYLKFDLALVRNIDKDLIKQELLTTLISFAQKINSHIIAEGIETESEYEKLLEMGIELGQGYYIARPGTSLK